jgi:hypothetical protein
MPSQRKSDSARANGAKSRGPTTPAGKENSSRNSLRHGFTSRSTIVLECENPEEFQEMLANYRATYSPMTPAEIDLVDQMVAARWRIRRIWVIETAMLDAEILRRKPEVQKQFAQFDGATELALAFRSLADDSRSLHLASRYESRLFRMHDRAYCALRDLQLRRGPAPDPAIPHPPEAPVPPENIKFPNEPTAPVVPAESVPCSAPEQAKLATHPRGRGRPLRFSPRRPSRMWLWGRLSICSTIGNRRRLARVNNPRAGYHPAPPVDFTRPGILP